MRSTRRSRFLLKDHSRLRLFSASDCNALAQRTGNQPPLNINAVVLQ